MGHIFSLKHWESIFLYFSIVAHLIVWELPPYWGNPIPHVCWNGKKKLKTVVCKEPYSYLTAIICHPNWNSRGYLYNFFLSFLITSWSLGLVCFNSWIFLEFVPSSSHSPLPHLFKMPAKIVILYILYLQFYLPQNLFPKVMRLAYNSNLFKLNWFRNPSLFLCGLQTFTAKRHETEMLESLEEGGNACIF